MDLIMRFQRSRNRFRESVQAYSRYLVQWVKYKNPGRPSKEIIIDIDDIKYRVDDRQLSRKSGEYRKIYKGRNSIIDGKFWTYLQPVDKDSPKLKGFEERFSDGLDWRDTSLFKDYKEKLVKGMRVQGCTSMDGLVELYEQHHDPLFIALKSDGLKSARTNPEITPIYVYIYKDGSFVYTSGGNHRLNMARVLGIKTMPVYIRGRHLEWQMIREELYRSGREAFLENYPSLAEHPDLFD